MIDNKTVVVDFNNNINTTSWRVVDDVVMGGRSNGTFQLDHQIGCAIFSGYVSLENNGGFSSIRRMIEPIMVENKSTIILRVKGDGHKYQFRIRHKIEDYYSYIYEFKTSGNWEDIIIPLGEMVPRFRGRSLRKSNFNHEVFEEVAFLIGNKKAESFELHIQRIYLQ